MNIFSKFSLNNEYYKDLLLITLLGFSLRIIFINICNIEGDFNGGDSLYYLDIANNLLNYNIHGEQLNKNFYRPPLYSALLAVFLSVSKNPYIIIFFHSLLSYFYVLILYFILRKFSKKLSLYCSIAIFCSPFEILMNLRVLSENVVTPLMVIASLCIININKKNIYYPIVLGITLGLLTLGRDVYILLPFLILIILYNNINKVILFLIISSYIFITFPWIIRNSQISNGGFFISKGILWQNIWVGTWEKDGKWMGSTIVDKVPSEALTTYRKIPSEILQKAWEDKNQLFFKNESISYIIDNPTTTLFTWAQRYPYLWVGTRSDLNNFLIKRYSVVWYLMKLIFFMINLIVLILAILGIIKAIKTKDEISKLSIPILYSGLIYIPLHNVETRYTLPVFPLMIIFSIYYLINYKKRS